VHSPEVFDWKLTSECVPTASMRSTRSGFVVEHEAIVPAAFRAEQKP
jgi:hypothetical protein